MATTLLLAPSQDGLVHPALKKMGHKIIQPVNGKKALEAIEENGNIDLVLLELSGGPSQGTSAIEQIKKIHPLIIIIVLSAYNDNTFAIECFRAGANDYLKLPVDYEELKTSIERNLRFLELQEEVKQTEIDYRHPQGKATQKFPTKIVGSSRSIKNVLGLAARVAGTHDTSVLITGESGTGKELIARSIHLLSNRKNNLFHCVNCSAIPETLFESEFFGYKKGAFTGANESTPGWFEVSHHSSLFLDEVGDLPLAMQSKFLRVLDDKMISKIGTTKGISLDLRIIAATNQDLEAMVENKLFRADLYHRLNSFTINIPPLREHKEDIPELVNYFVRIFSQQLGKNIQKIDDDVYTRLMEYSFPGNVRELRNMVEKAMILCDKSYLSFDDFCRSMEKTTSCHQVSPSHLFDLEKIEHATILEALKSCDHNKTKAAKLLNISRQSLNRKINKYGICLP